MKESNLAALTNLGKTCYRSGYLPIFLGLIILFIGIVNRETQTMLTGLYIFIVGYSYVKLASKITKIIKDEK